MFVANFLGGPDRGDHYRKPINVQATLIDFLVYKILYIHLRYNLLIVFDQ